MEKSFEKRLCRAVGKQNVSPDRVLSLQLLYHGFFGKVPTSSITNVSIIFQAILLARLEKSCGSLRKSGAVAKPVTFTAILTAYLMLLVMAMYGRHLIKENLWIDRFETSDCSYWLVKKFLSTSIEAKSKRGILGECTWSPSPPCFILCWLFPRIFQKS